MQLDWYRSFFSGVALDFWRKAMPPAQTQAEVDFLAQTLAPTGAPARLLDVPCGNGRHTLALAARGHRLTGVDLAAEFIDEAIAAAAAAGLAPPPEFVRADLRALPWSAEFDGAFCMGNSFGYLDHAGSEAFLAAVAAALAPGGRFVLETGAAAECLLPSLAERRWWQVDDIYMLVTNRYQPLESRLDTEYRFLRPGAPPDVRASCQHVYTVAELGRMLARAGLPIRELFSSVARAPFQLGSPRLILIAERR